MRLSTLFSILLLAVSLTACGSDHTGPSHPTTNVRVKTQGYIAHTRMNIADFSAAGLDTGEALSFRNGLDTLTETGARVGYLVLHRTSTSAAYMVDGEDSVITIPADTADSAAYKAFSIPTNDIACIHDSVAVNDPGVGAFPPVIRILLVDSLTNTYTDFFAHDSTDPSGSQMFVTLWLTDTATVNNPNPNVSLPVEFSSVQRLETGTSIKYTFDLRGTPQTFSACRFTANQ